MNKKGFVLIETLVVTIFVMFIFSILYNSVVPLLGRYEELSYYDDLDTTYDLYHLKNLVRSDINFETIKANSRGYQKITCNDLENKSYCNYMFSNLGISDSDSLVYLDIKHINDLKNDSDYSYDLRDYLNYIDTKKNILLLENDDKLSYIEVKSTIISEIILDDVKNSTCDPYIEEDGIIYLSGTNDCVNFNYVWYSGKLWRITAIYPDGTMKMITDGMITSIAYGADNKFYTDENTTSYMYQWLNQEFLPTLYNYDEIIVEDAVWNASPGNGSISTKLPVSGQEEVLVNASVGLLNSYEYYKSYQNTSYRSGYLNIDYYFWLLNPYSASSSYVWYVVSSVGSGSYSSPSTPYGVRPSIYLKSGVQLIGGTGTLNDPYRIKGDQEEAKANITLINTRQSGEYVNFNKELYRIVGIENGTTKLIKDDYVKDESSTILLKAVASSTTFGKDTNTRSDNYWDYYLNNTWKLAIEDTYENMLLEGTYYTKSLTGGNYKGTACLTISNTTSIKDCAKTGISTWTGYVGLPRYGEMFASQTRDYTYSNARTMWLITPYSSSYVWYVGNDGRGYIGPASSYGVRPTINLKSEILIESGSGIKSDPYEIKLS